MSWCLTDGNATFTDISVSGFSEKPTVKLSHVAYINRLKVPLFLVSRGPHDVFTTNNKTETYFKHMLAMPTTVNAQLGQLLRTDSPNCYVVMYYSVKSGSIRCFELDLDIPKALDALCQSASVDSSSNVYFSSLAPRADTSVFDRVLQNKSKRNTYLAPPAPSKTPLSVSVLAGDQISQAVSKVTLSGLRLRGLNPSDAGNSKNRTIVRELYHQTRKSALFALRKYNYTFNGSHDKSIRLQDVQDVVERLLQAYVDIDDNIQ